MPGDQTITPVEVVSRHCLYTGLLATRGRRVSDVLSDPGTDVLEMQETRTRLVGAGSTDVLWKQVQLRKDQILMVLPKGTYEAPAQRCSKYVEKPRYGAMVILPGNVLSGVLHLPERTTPLTLLSEGASLSRFLGLTEVTVHSSIHALEGSKLGVVILRRFSIESVQLTAQPLPKRTAASGPVEVGSLS